MWYGVVMTVLVEVFPAEIRSTAVATFAFVISNIGGNLPVIVTPLKHAVGGLRNALYITYPGFYFLSKRCSDGCSWTGEARVPKSSLEIVHQ